MKTKNALGHYIKKKEAAENHVRRWRLLPILLCLLGAVLLWLIILHFEPYDYQKSSFFKPEPHYSAETKTE